jgi:hypothetical protein
MIHIVLYIDILKEDEDIYILKSKNNKVTLSKEYSVLSSQTIQGIKELIKQTIVEKLSRMFAKNEIVIKGNKIGLVDESGNENGTNSRI